MLLTLASTAWKFQVLRAIFWINLLTQIVNKRTNHHGGIIANICHFVLEVVNAVAEAIGEEKTAIRISPCGDFQDMKDDTPVETYGYLVSELQKRHPKLAYLHLIEVRSTLHD